MARPKSFNVRKPLVKLFPEKRLEKIARETGAVKRQRKVKIVPLFWSVILGFAVGRKRTISGMRRSYEKSTGQSIEESSFYDRFSSGFVSFLKTLVAQAIGDLPGIGRSLKGSLSGFADLILTDSTVMRLHDMLAKTFPGVRTNHSPASLKMHAVISVTGKGKSSVKMTPGKRHDGPVFTVGKWVRDKLLLFDLGYYRYQLFACIHRNKGYFISRLKSCSDLEIISQNLTCRGRSVDLVGKSVQTVADTLKREVIDVMVNTVYWKRGYGGYQTQHSQTFRVVGIRNEDEGCYHFFITNIPFEKISAEEIATVYAARWEVELLFREMKSQYRLEDLPSRKRNVVEALVYASILTLVVSRVLLIEIQKAKGISVDETPRQRWATLFSTVTPELLVIMVRPPKETGLHSRLLAQMILYEAIDPNRNRRSLIEAVETGTHKYERRTR